MTIFLLVLQRELRCAWRARADLGLALAFFIIVASLFPFGVGALPQQLHAIGPGVCWIAALLATLLALPRLFGQDYDNGTLEQLLLSPEPPVLWLLAKLIAHWLTTGLPLVVCTPLIGLMYQLELNEIALLALSLLLGSPGLTLIGAIGAALTLGLRGANSLLALLVLPLMVPLLIFGAGAVDALNTPSGAGAHLSLLGAALLFGIVISPLTCLAGLRLALE